MDLEYKKRVGIMGGTFNPIHLGHMIAAQNALEAYDLDEILFVPSGIPYMKENVLDVKSRIAMTGIAIEDNSNFALSTIEADREGNSYSYETIADLKKAHPTTRYYFIVGSDSLFMMDKWKCPEKIFEEVTVLVAPRLGYSEKELQKKIEELTERYHADINVLPMNCVDISSTAIRDKVREHKSIRYLVHYRVIEYIEKHHLYQDGEA